MRSYAIGDIHGQLEMLHDAHARIAADRARCGDEDAPIIHLGDYVDRGPDSRGVVRFLREGVARGENWVAIKGNHDRMLYEFMADPLWRDPGMKSDLSWLNPRLGGDKTLASYGAGPAEVLEQMPKPAVWEAALPHVPDEDLAFLQELPLMYRRGEVLYVHAGIRPGVALEDQVENDLVWIRDGYLDDPRDYGFLIVHGHTALDYPVHFGNRVDLDGGAGYGRPLAAAVIEGRDVFLLTEDGRVPLRPE